MSILTLILQRPHNLNRGRTNACPDADHRFVPPDKLSNDVIKAGPGILDSRNADCCKYRSCQQNAAG